MTTTAARLPLPAPIAWLYAIGILLAIGAIGIAFFIFMSTGPIGLLQTVPWALVVAIGGFVPALLGHGIVNAIRDAAVVRDSRVEVGR